LPRSQRERSRELGLPGFLDISYSILQENTLSVRFGAATTFSFPVLMRHGEKLADGMFLFQSPQNPGGLGPRPFAWIMLDSADGEALLLADCRIHDFAPGLPHDEQVRMALPRPMAGKTYARSYQELYEAYEELRIFAFEPDPADWQREAMERYKGLFLKLAYVGHYPYYRARSPEFFDWLDLLTGEAAEPASQEPEAPAEPDPDIGALLEGIRGEVTELSRMLAAKAEDEQQRQALLDKMHAELTEYRNGLVDAITEAMERDIVKMIDDLGKSIDAYRSRPPTRDNYQRFFVMFEGVRTDLADLLYRQGVEPFRVEGNKVEILRQQILSTVPTQDPSLDKTVAQRVSQGWEKNGKVIRPERISVYVYSEEA